MQHSRGSAVRDGLFRKEEFRYDPTSDTYLCPGGQHLHPLYRCVKGNHTTVQYCNRAACRGCELKPQCTADTYRRVGRWTEEAASKFFAAVLDDARVKGLLSDEHFSVDGTLIQAWASLKRFRPKDGSGEPPAEGRNGERDFKGEKRSNETHHSASDDDARLFRKGDGQASQLCFIGHVLMENRNGLAVDAELTRAAGSAERLAALAMAENLPAGHKTLGADKGYDTHDFVMELRELGITPHARNAYDKETARRRSAIDGRTTRHDGYAVSQKKRKRIEEICIRPPSTAAVNLRFARSTS
jgi:Transposase DDE domain